MSEPMYKSFSCKVLKLNIYRVCVNFFSAGSVRCFTITESGDTEDPQKGTTEEKSNHNLENTNY